MDNYKLEKISTRFISHIDIKYRFIFRYNKTILILIKNLKLAKICVSIL